MGPLHAGAGGGPGEPPCGGLLLCRGYQRPTSACPADGGPGAAGLRFHFVGGGCQRRLPSAGRERLPAAGHHVPLSGCPLYPRPGPRRLPGPDPPGRPAGHHPGRSGGIAGVHLYLHPGNRRRPPRQTAALLLAGPGGRHAAGDLGRRIHQRPQAVCLRPIVYLSRNKSRVTIHRGQVTRPASIPPGMPLSVPLPNPGSASASCPLFAFPAASFSG